jgi:hypothetical protein
MNIISKELIICIVLAIAFSMLAFYADHKALKGITLLITATYLVSALFILNQERRQNETKSPR